MYRRNTIATFCLTALLVGCASAGGVADPSTPTNPTGPSGPSTTEPLATKGWIGGEPEWSNADATGGYAESGTMDAATSADAMPASPAIAEGEPTGGGNTASPLRAGSVDDNADLNAFVEYLARVESLGVTTRPFDPTGRIVVSVTGTSGLPVAGAEVTVTAGGVAVATVRTTADGTARFLPMLYGAQPAESYDFAAGPATGSAAPGGAVALTSDLVGGAQAPVAIDVLFLLDATGSMGDEIDRLKTTIDSVAGRIAGLDGQPDVRFGMTLYRDLQDSFTTSTFDFTGDVSAFQAAIADVTAEGGDDYPEALDEGLADALAAPTWRDPASTVQLVFLVADAPPQVAREVQSPYTASILDAVARGVKIIPIASSESDDQAEAVFRQLAQATGGRFVFLSYGAGGAATGSSTDIDSTDYEELSLDDLIVRLVGEELAALTGAPSVEGPTDTIVTTPPTNPDGQ